MILYIKHIDIEGPGTLGKFFEQQGFESKTVELLDGDKLPSNLDRIDAVISLGGPMNVYEEDQYPALRDENRFIQDVLKAQIPFMGLCLGSQLLAKACDAKVGKSPEGEIGFFGVELTKVALDDPLFRGLDLVIEAFHWHEDMSELPKNAQLLASSSGCPHQAFKVGKNAYGIQFHVEITDKSIIEWSDKYIKKHPDCEDMKNKMLSEYKEKKEKFDQTAEVIYGNFLKIIKEVSYT